MKYLPILLLTFVVGCASTQQPREDSDVADETAISMFIILGAVLGFEDDVD